MRLMSMFTLLAFGAIVSGQEGAATLPSNYTLQFENAWVKVTAVRYEPLQKLPGHTHTPNPSAYVYLNDGPPVKFRHIGGHNVVATRPATKAGAFRVYRGLEEVHEVENTGNTPSEFLRVELKTAVVDAATFRGKFERPEIPSTQPVVHLDHPQVRISRLWVQPGEELGITTGAEPSLLIALGEGAGLALGQERWVAPSSVVRLKNTGTNAFDLLRFEFKTRPTVTDR